MAIERPAEVSADNVGLEHATNFLEVIRAAGRNDEGDVPHINHRHLRHALCEYAPTIVP